MYPVKELGGFMSLNFKEMPTLELKTYVLSHRNDGEAFEEYRSRLKPTSPAYSFPRTEAGTKQMEEVLRQKIQEIESLQRSAE